MVVVIIVLNSEWVEIFFNLVQENCEIVEYIFTERFLFDLTFRKFSF